MSQRSETPIKRTRHDSDINYPGDIWPEQSCAGDCSDKQRQYKHKLVNFGELTEISGNTHLAEKITKLTDELKEMKESKEDDQKKLKKFNNWIKEIAAREKGSLITQMPAQSLELKKSVEVLKKQLFNKQEVIRVMKDCHLEKVKRLEIKNKKYEIDITALNKKLSEKSLEEMETISEKEEIIERLQNEVKIKTKRSNRYKSDFERCRTNILRVRAELKKIKTENENLTKQRKYFQYQTENNKLKFIGVSHTTIKMREVYANAMRKAGQNFRIIMSKTMKNLKEVIEEQEKEAKSADLQNMADNITEVGKQLKDIEEVEKQIIKKRADRRVQCVSCPLTFCTGGDLTHHMTVTHKIHISDRSKNIIEIVTIDD